jgi:hypothetical protein
MVRGPVVLSSVVLMIHLVLRLDGARGFKQSGLLCNLLTADSAVLRPLWPFAF